MTTRILAQLGPPDELRGAMSIWVGLVIAVLSISGFSGSQCSFSERFFFTVPLTLPVLLLSRAGHFGRGRWTFPSVVALVYLVWNLGILPSLAAAAPPEVGTYQFRPAAKLVGGLAFFVWFVAFAIGAGRVGDEVFSLGVKKDSIPKIRVDQWLFLTFFIIWVLIAIEVGKQGMLSSWGYSFQPEELVKTKLGVMFLFYTAFVGIMPLLCIWAWLRSDRAWKLVFLILFVVSVIALIIYSNRRITIVTGLIGLFFFYKCFGKFKWKVVLLGSVGVWLMIGPLLWPVRIAVQSPDLLGGHGNTIQIVKEALVKYIYDPGFREAASEAGADNLKEGRFNYADSFLATVQWVNVNGAHGSPSFLFAPVTMVPSFLWDGKNDVAADLNVKKQFNMINISDEPDFPMSPIQEAFFQYSFFGVLLGGLFWGWYCRMLMLTFSRAWMSFEGMLIWAAFIFGSFTFEGFFSMFLTMIREALLIFIVVFLFRRYVFANIFSITLIRSNENYKSIAEQ